FLGLLAAGILLVLGLSQVNWTHFLYRGFVIMDRIFMIYSPRRIQQWWKDRRLERLMTYIFHPAVNIISSEEQRERYRHITIFLLDALEREFQFSKESQSIIDDLQSRAWNREIHNYLEELAMALDSILTEEGKGRFERKGDPYRIIHDDKY